MGEPTAALAGEVAAPELGPGDTCHLDVADRFGNLVSATPSGGWLQSSPVVPGLGFCLGTRAQMFSADAGLRQLPGPRPPARAPPCRRAWRCATARPYLAFGTPGGDQQDQWTLAVFLNHAVFGMNLQEAIDFPAFYDRPLPVVVLPARIPAPLAGRRVAPPRAGHRRPAPARPPRSTCQGPWSLGRVSAVSRSGGFLYAGANPRGMQGYAAGR